MPKTSHFGSWKSPITSDLVVQGGIGLGQIQFDGDDLYWVEQRPSEAGRNVIVKRARDGKISDVTPAPFNARTRVHEYGGAAFAVDRGTVWFSNFADQRIFRQDPGSAPRAISPAQDLRYADAVIDRVRNRMIVVREDHTGSGEAVNTIVALDLDGDTTGGKILASGNNFYSNPRLNAAGTILAWLQWNHPNMPWDGTELWTGSLNERGDVTSPNKIAGGENESIFQPEWAPDGTLYFVSDRTGWWNLDRARDGQIEAMHPRAAEFGVPQWVFGLTTYAIESATRIVCTYSERGSHLAILDTTTRAFDEIKIAYTSMGSPRVSNGRVAFIAGSASQPSSLVLLDLKTHRLEVLRRSSEIKLDPGFVSAPQAIEFPTENGLTAHAIYYPPANQDAERAALKNSKPPLIVKSHGGPTAATGTTLNLGIQFWTSRGFAVVDVNYGGSTGYGRAYRERLNGTWGVVDVDDCVNAAKYLVKKGLADGKRLAITGGSAGGYTTLTAIALRDVFTAAASHFGIGDLEFFAKDTHKYESRYLDRLVGPYPDKRDVYRARSAMNFVDNINCPLILFQGLEDKIVPPNQSQMMFDAVKKKGLPCAYVAFEGEQHGFRQAKNIRRSLDGELYFYSKVFGFELAENIEPVQIENLPNAKPQAQSQKRKGASKRLKPVRAQRRAGSPPKKTAGKKQRTPSKK